MRTWGGALGLVPPDAGCPAGPVGSILSAWLGPRPIVMAGGILASLGLILASFATSLIQLYLTIGLLTGTNPPCKAFWVAQGMVGPWAVAPRGCSKSKGFWESSPQPSSPRAKASE